MDILHVNSYEYSKQLDKRNIFEGPNSVLYKQVLLYIYAVCFLTITALSLIAINGTTELKKLIE